MRKADLNLDTKYGHCQGFSLVELMVALVITLILLAGIGQIYLSSKKSFTIQDTLGHQQENARYAVETIAQDLRRASYWGGNADIDLISGTLGMVNIATNPGIYGTCSTSDTTWGRMLNRPIFGINNTNNDTSTSPVSDYTDCIPSSDYLGSDILVTRYQAPWQVGSQTTPNFEPNRLYLRSSLTASGEALGRIFQGTDEGNILNDMDYDLSTPSAPAAGASPDERVAELVAHGYYIGPSPSTKCRGTAVPSLLRESLNDQGKPAGEEVATGVEKFEVIYGIDTDDDRSADNYVDAGDSKIDTDWSNVVAVQYWLLTRADCPETGYTNTNTYTLAGVDYKPNDGYRRQLYSTTVMLRNR
jgi:type IV pilus assembly protein PilW